MKVSTLTKELYGKNPINALKKFNIYMKDCPDKKGFIQEFLAFSNTDGILQLLDRKQVKFGHLKTLFESLSNILLNLTKGVSVHSDVALNIARQLFGRKAKRLSEILGDGRPERIKAALNCLIGMVEIGGEPASLVLNFIDPKDSCFARFLDFRNVEDTVDVRACYIQLLLKFLTTEDLYLANQFLDRTDLLTSIFPGLKMDRSDQLLRVLKVLHESLLLNPNVTKTTKVRIFTPKNIKYLTILYKWERPGKQKSKDKTLIEEADVREEVQKVLITLCSSYKHGIAFRVNKYHKSGSNSNLYVYETISSLSKPWGFFEGKQLMSHVFAACPDILAKYLGSLEYLLVPRPSVSFVSLMGMLVEIMKCQKPWTFARSTEWEVVVPCLFPGPPLTSNFYDKLSQSENGIVRHVGCTLMLTILIKVKETMKHLQDSKLSMEVQEKIQHELIGSASKTFTTQTVKTVIRTWRSIVDRSMKVSHNVEDTVDDEGIDDTSVPAAVEILTIAKFLCCYNELITSPIVEEFLNPVDLLKTVNFLSNMEFHEQNRSALAKSEFWKICHELLVSSINNGNFGVNVQILEENVFYLLISIYAQYEGSHELSTDLSSDGNVCANVVSLMSDALSKAGISEDCEGSIRYWLKSVSGPNYVKLSAFLTHIIQKILSSYNEHTDYLIEFGEKCPHAYYPSLMSDLGIMDVNEPGHVSTTTIFKPFSRFVLAAVDLLSANPDNECSEYFACVMFDYVHTLNNPGILASFLLEKHVLMKDSLQEYLGYFLKHPLSFRGKAPEFDSDASLSDLLKFLFMTKDWASVSDRLKDVQLKNLMNGDPQIVILQLMMYLQIELENENSDTSPLVKIYTKLLEDIYLCFEENDDKLNAKVVIKTVLEHPRIKSSFLPFFSGKCPISSLCQYFIKVIFEKHSDISICTYPYYFKILKEVKSMSGQPEACFDCWSVVTLFISSDSTILSYKDIEELLVIYFKLPWSTSSDSYGAFLHKLLKLLSRTTTAKRQPEDGTVHLMLNKYLEEVQRTPVHNDIVSTLEKFLPRVMTEKIAKELSHDDLKRLLLCHPPCADLCCQLVKLHPQHGVFFASRLKKFDRDFPAQTQLLNILLQHEESMNAAQETLTGLQAVIKEWAMGMRDDGEHFQDLLVHAINADIMDKKDLLEISSRIFERIVNEKWLPPKGIGYFLILFQKVSEDKLLNAKLPLADSNLALLHILLSLVRSNYRKDKTDTVLLLECYQILKEILPRINTGLLHTSVTSSKLWPSFVKQVLRIGLNDIHTGPSMLHALDLMIDAVHKNNQEKNDVDEENSLTLVTIYQMIMSHTQYLEVMFQREDEWDKLKESVVALQQTVANYEENVCLELHVPILLGAYGASMSATDQRILKLLHFYETKGFMKRYQPVLWGDSAISHFGMLKSAVNMYKEPKVEQILTLLDKNKIYRTCSSFNSQLSLEPQEIYGDDKSIYDMRFLVPLMLYLAEEKGVLEIDFAESGTVAVGLTCLSSYQEEMWGAGAAILKCVVEKMKKSRHHRFKLPWMWTIIIVGCSLNGQRRRLASVIVHYLVCVSRLLSNPEDPLYFPILRSLFIKPVLNINRVPQLSRLYSSGDVFDSRIHLSFLLKFLSTGIRLPEDYFICEQSSTAMLIISLLQSPTADSEIKVQALEVLESMVHLPVAAQELVSKHNVLTLLPIAISPVASTTNDSVTNGEISYSGKSLLIVTVVKVLAAIWPSMFIVPDKKTSRMKNYRFEQTSKRKRDEESDDEENDEEDIGNVSKKFKSDENGVCDIGNASKKVKSDEDDTGLDRKYLNVTAIGVDKHRTILPPLFVEEYLNCLLHLVPTVVEHGPPESAAEHLSLIADTVKYVTTISKQLEKETLRHIAMDPHMLKERVFAHVRWEFLHKCLRKCLTDSEEVRLLGHKIEDHKQEWQEECLSEYLENEHQNITCEDGGLQKLKISVLSLLDVLEK